MLPLYKEKRRQRQRLNKKQWYNWFRETYGEYPLCEVCGKILQWQGNRNEVVHFDHRHNKKAFIKGRPSCWVWTHACNVKNQEIWDKCDFGILCAECNKRLPTNDRIQWLNNITRYIHKRE